MFANLLNLSFKRTRVQAFGFWLAWTFMGVLICGIVGGLSGIFLNARNYSSGFSEGLRWGGITAVLFSLAVGLQMAKEKNAGFSGYLLAISGGVLAVIGGGLLGLVPVAYLSTRAVSPMREEAGQ
jgi:hypothetical protein